MEEGELGCDSGDWDGDGDGDVIGGGGSEICRSEMVVVQKSERRRKSFDVLEETLVQQDLNQVVEILQVIDGEQLVLDMVVDEKHVLYRIDDE
ncbi:hypothetical protein Tco_1079505 [Tanacetum coccineum]|uniref:Uncharacterized protein n=1 Tax=Tanacetum coccineum TaxID=301880 RepID=A0ABQ5HTJ3_9ASTR